MGAQLVVQEGQAAVFYRDGKALDTFGPGRHTLTTANIPILTKILSIPFGLVGFIRAASPEIKGGFASIFSMLIGVVGIVVAVVAMFTKLVFFHW